MQYVILVSQAGQQTYDDSERHYTYPARYNAALAPLMAGEPTVVILYQEFPGGTRCPPERCQSRPYTDFCRLAQHSARICSLRPVPHDIRRRSPSRCSTARCLSPGCSG